MNWRLNEQNSHWFGLQISENLTKLVKVQKWIIFYGIQIFAYYIHTKKSNRESLNSFHYLILAYNKQLIERIDQFIISFLNYKHFLVRKDFSMNTPITYYPLQLFCVYSMKLFFREVTVIGEQNIPADGPIIIYGNHNNQFVDGILMMANIKRTISFIAAAVSCRRPFLGHMIKGTGAIPVQRPADIARKGKGKIVKLHQNKVFGQNTNFLQIKSGQIVSIPQFDKKQLKVKQVLSDVEFIFQGKPQICLQGQSAYSVIPKLEFNDLYQHVWAGLNQGKCIGIFPQGGSHDRMDLLPLKAGICIMALGAMQKYNKPIKLIPCGFNYYNPSKFRSKVIMEFGQAYTIPQQLVQLYRKNKKQAISILLSNLEQMLRQVTTQFSSFQQLNTLLLARQLYTLNSIRPLTVKEKLQLNRRFAKGFKLVAHKPQYKESYEKLVEFSQFVRLNGIKLTKQNYFSSVITDFLRFVLYLEKCVFRCVIALPGIILMGPPTTLISYLAEKQRIKCKNSSKVKEEAHDVVGSYKILLSMILLPATAVVHSTLLYTILTKYLQVDHKKSLKASLISFALLPLYALVMVKSYDSFGRSLTKLKHFFWRLFHRNFYQKFNTQKKTLSKKILKFIDEHGNQVVQNLQENRILKKQHMAQANTELYIFDEQRQQNFD